MWPYVQLYTYSCCDSVVPFVTRLVFVLSACMGIHLCRYLSVLHKVYHINEINVFYNCYTKAPQ